jgi:hypothetical protein
MAYQEFTGQLDGEQPAAAAQATSFIPFDGKLDEPANAAPAPVKSLEAAPDDSNEAAMTNPMGDVAGTVDRVAQPEEKNQVGIIESAARAFPEGSAKFAKTAGLAASAPAVVFDYVKNAITGSKETTASDWAFSNFVQPWDKRAEFFAIKPEEKQNILGKIGSAIGSLGADLPYMIMSGGGAAEGEALQAVPKAAEYLATAVKRGFDAMRPVMIKAGSEKAEEVLNKGGSIDQAVAAGTTAALMTGAMGSAPMSVEGNFFKRLATGVPIGVVTTELQRQIQNAAMPDNMQQPFDAENLAVGSVTNALTAGVMGHPEQPAMPSRAELGYLPPKTAMADAVTGAYTGQPAPQPIINTARASAADIGAAKTMDEVINAATSAVPTLNPNAVRARSETAVSDLLKQIRPIEQGATDALPADAVRVLDGGDQGAENRAPGMESAAPGSEAAGIPAEAGPANPAQDVAAHGNDLPGAEQPADAQPALKAEDAGIPIDQEWRAFPDNSGTLGIPRAEMPQIRAEHRGPMVNFLNARGIDHEQLDIPASDLKPTQQEFSPAKVQQAREYAGGDRSILVSSDGHVLDGHHQWLAKLEAGEPVKAIRLNAPIRDLIDQVREFPSAEVAEGAARALPGSEILAQQRFRPEHGQVSVIDPATLGGSGIGDKTISGGFARFVQALGSALGKDVYFFRQEGAKTRIDGFAPAKNPDAIFVNVHAGDAAWHYVAGHEFFHQMPEDLRTHFIDAVKPLVKPEAFKALKDYINQDHLNDAGHWEEIAADLFGNRFGEKAFFDQLAQRLPDRSVAARVFDYIRQFIDKMTQALQGAGKQFKTDRFVDDLEKVRAAAADALGRYLRNERAPEAAIGGRRVSEFSDKELDRFARSKGASGESARREIERRKQALADMSPAERRQQTIEALQGRTTRELREIAESDRRSYMRAAAADLLQERQEAVSAKRSASARKFLQKQTNIDADQDTMASAIAKLGGVNRESAAGRMRLAPEELNTKANVGNLARNIFVKGKGRRMDEMGELLAELGYVDRDEQGKHDQRDFEDKLARIAGGEEIYTPQGLMRRAEEMRAMEMKEVHADSPEEFAIIEQYADELEDWAAKHAVDLEKDPDLDAGDANPLITDEDIDAYFGSSKEESAGGTDQENPAKASQEGAETDRTAEKEFSLEQHDASDLKAKDARDTDRALADKQLADSQRDAFTLTAPEGTVEGEANAMANTRQDNLFSKQRKEELRDLIVQHNISASKLLHTDRMGGLPVPSLAVTRKGAPMQSFGEITLLGSRNMVDPKGYAKTKVYGADIYSPRYPSVEYKAARANLSRFNESLKKYADLTDAREISNDDLEREPLRALRKNGAVMAQFLEKNGIEPHIIKSEPNESMKMVLDNPDVFGPFMNETNRWHLMEDKAFQDAVIGLQRKKFADALGEDDPYVQHFDKLSDSQREGRARDAAEAIVELHKIDPENMGPDRVGSENAMRKQIEEMGLRDSFDEFVESALEKIDPEERIFNGYTNSGNRRYIPHTLENVVKILKKELRGGENWNYGVGSVRAHYTPEFRTIKQIQEHRDRIVSKEDFEKIKQEIDDEFQGLISELQPHHSASNRFGFGDTVSMAMSDAAKMGIPRALHENGFDEVPTEVQEEMRDFMNKLRNLPTEYFEAKILRDVSLAEFAGAVIPHNASDKVRAILKKHGLPFAEYQKGDEAARRQAIADFAEKLDTDRGDMLFSQQRRVTPDDDTLHLDTPLSAQSYEIRRAIRNEIKRLRAEAWQMADFHGDPDKAEEKVTGQDLLDRIADRLRGVEMAREYLHALGVPKIGDEDGVKSSTERKPVFFSQLDRAVDQVPAKVDNTSAANWKAWLLNNASKLGVKADEIKWSGISDYLDLLGKKKVSKEEIRDYLAQNGVKVKEVMKGEGKPQRLTVRENNGAWDIVDPDGRVLDTIEDRETAESDAEEMSAERYGASDTSYSKYTLPGGDNYRELLLTLPQEVKRADPQEVARVIEARKKIFDEYQPRLDRLKADADAAQLAGARGAAERNMQDYNDLMEERDYRARDEVGEVPQDRVLPPKYETSHWKEPNILAHIRFNDRTDADGKRVLFIEEMQSDWGQEGKRRGFAGTVKELPDGYKTEPFGEPLAGRQQYVVRDENGRSVGSGWSEDEAVANALKKMSSDEYGKIKSAPFVTDTKAWVSLAMKRMIRYAAENGYDKIAFVNGTQSADRYDLSKQISRVQFDDNSSGGIGKPDMDGPTERGMLHAYDLNGKEIISQHVESPAEIEDLIGKEAAKKLLEQSPKEARTAGLGVRRRELSGLDLKVGGEGMKAFYDQIVPQVANDVLKKLGGGKVGEVKMLRPVDGDIDPNWGTPKFNPDKWEMNDNGEVLAPQQGFDITPELRSKAMEGMPLFTTQRNPLRPDYDGPGAQFVNDARSSLKEIIDDALMKASPMSLGTDQARAIAKQWANNDRLARMQWTQFDNVLKKNYTDEQRRAMWEAADEENVLRQQGLPTAGMGLDRLPADQRNTMETLHTYAEGLLQRARDAGMFQGDGLPYWTPRMAALIGEDGEYMRVPSGMGGGSSDQGRNIISSAPSLKQRKYLTAAETEAAMKTKFGENAEIVRDIRTMPLAMARLERAIAGRELINQIKELGSATGVPTFSPSDGPNFFTIDHPAFKRYQPRFVKDEDGNTVVATDQNGDPIFDRVPIYVSKDFEGPLRAIMSDKTGKLYQAFMNLKMKTMGLIMYSPLIHNAVEWGRALPVMPGKVATFRIYFEGNRVKNDPAQMRQAIKDGMVPIGQRGMNQDLVAMMNDPHLLPGKSLTAKLIGGAVGLVNEHAGTQVKKAIDKAGEIWHQTLLWDRVGDLQAGLYANMKETLIDKGLDEQSAGRLAAHFANRYAGALPNEAMSVNARKIANFVLFSRSFTLGNLGALKDIVTGMPKDVQSQIKMDAGEAALKLGKSIARKKAAMAFALDLALLYAGNSLLQDALDKMKRDKSLGEIGQGYADRLHRLVSKVKENPLSLVDPFYIPDHLSSTAENEPGKEDRIHYGDEDTGTAVYMRLPTGKIGEEFKGWIKSPLETIKRKEGTIMRPITQTIENDKGFGRRVYDPEAEGIKGAVKNLGRIVWNFMTQQVPADSIQAASDWASGHADETDKLKAAGPLVGLTFSKGAPGGPAVGEQYYVERKHQGDVMDIMPDVNRALKLGDRDRAIEMMENVKMTPQEILNVIRKNEAPESRLNNRSLKKFNQRASDDEKERMDRLRR